MKQAEAFLQIIEITKSLLRENGSVFIAIDGRAASGKTTFAAKIKGELESKGIPVRVFHADDYFLPAGMRTPERLAEPGGNVDRERLKAEIIDHARGDVRMRRFDCAAMEMGEAVSVPFCPVTVLEGSYSQHPFFGDVFDLRVFLTVPPDVQKDRIAARDKSKLEAFLTRWTPMEEAYFSAFGIPDRSDFLIDTGK